MHTARSASSAAIPSMSAADAATTHSRPRRLQARTTLTAISPRLAISTRLTATTPSLAGGRPLAAARRGRRPPGIGGRDPEQGLAVLDQLPVVGQHLDDRAANAGRHRVHHLHHLDDAHRLVWLDLGADL